MTAFKLELPLPPSTNSLYRNVSTAERTSNRRLTGRVKTQAYRDWLGRADMRFLLQKRSTKAVHGQFEITIRRPEGAIDTDNMKAILDVLKRWNLIDDDGPKYCRKYSVEIVDGMDLCEVQVRGVG